MALLGHVAIPSDILQSDYIHGAAVDQAGRIFICGRLGVVYRLSDTGVLEATAATGFSYTTNLKVDETGRLIVGQSDGWVSMGYTTLANEFTYFLALDEPGDAYGTNFVAFTPPLPPPPPLQLVSVVSEQTHGSAGTFSIDLPLQGSPGIECRNGGSDGEYAMVFTFTNPLVDVDSVTVSSGGGQRYWSKIGSDPHQYLVHLVTVPNGQVITVTLGDVRDNAGNIMSAASASMALLIGDVNGSGTVTTGDTNLCKAQALQSVTLDNFRNDINASGAITTGDVNLIKQNALSHLPPPP